MFRLHRIRNSPLLPWWNEIIRIAVPKCETIFDHNHNVCSIGQIGGVDWCIPIRRAELRKTLFDWNYTFFQFIYHWSINNSVIYYFSLLFPFFFFFLNMYVCMCISGSLHICVKPLKQLWNCFVTYFNKKITNFSLYTGQQTASYISYNFFALFSCLIGNTASVIQQ